MSLRLSFQWTALSRVATNLALGLLPFGLLAAFHPAVDSRVTAPIWLCLVLSLAIAGAFPEAPPTRGDTLRMNFHRALSCLLLGSSFAAIPWKIHEFTSAPGVVLTSLSIRWLLYALEAWELRLADLRKHPPPCLATRIRRAITLVTGCLIPLLILIGLPVIPLLALSFILTAFSQWTVACENHHTTIPSVSPVQ
jgi:hypothetical protein